MDLFFEFCNICYKFDDGSLKDISEENMKHLKDTLITFVGHADIINMNDIYLCHLCCEEIIRFDKFREQCLNHLIQLRQNYFNRLSKLVLQDNTAAGKKNILKKFVHQELLRRKCPLAISTQYHEENISGGLNKNDSVFNRQIKNLQSQGNDYEFIGDGNVLSVKNSVTECEESRVSCTNEEVMKNEIICFEEIKSEKFTSESVGDYNGSDINSGNGNDTSKIEFMKEELELNSEKECNESEYFTRKFFETESLEHANLHVKMPVVYNSELGVNPGIDFAKQELYVQQENSASEVMKSERVEDEFGDGLNIAFEIVNVSTILKMEGYRHEDITSKEAKFEMKSPRNKSSSPIVNARRNSPHVRLRPKGRCPATLKSPDAVPHTISACNESFRTSTSLTRHEREHSSDKPHKCSICNKAYTDISYLIIHERIHSGDRPFKCTVCNKSFLRSSHLIDHERIHSGVRPFKCSVCNKSFLRSSHLIDHERIHSGVRPYMCTTCNKTFTQLSNLIVHKSTHSTVRPYKCTVCSKAFIHSPALRAHERIHSGDKPYKCSVCNKSFVRSYHLIEHARTHSGVRPYRCTICNKSFTQSSHLVGHQRTHSAPRS